MHSKPNRREAERRTTKASSYFDEEQVFENEIRPLMEQIQAVALAHNMPFLLAVGYSHTSDAGFATASAGATIEGRTGEELYVATRLLSSPAFAETVLTLLANASPDRLAALREIPAPSRLM